MYSMLVTAALALGGASVFAQPREAELGGSVVAPHVARPLPSPVPVTVSLYDGPLCVATTQADLSGRYVLTAPPGDYWLQVKLGGQEVRVERIQLREGSWLRDLDIDAWLPWSTAPDSDAVAVLL